MDHLFFKNEEGLEGGEMPPSDFPAFVRELEYPSLRYNDGGVWWKDAKCRGRNDLLSLFFPVLKRGERRSDAVDKAKEFCADCAARKECFNFAKQNKLVDGIWGGYDFTPQKRVHLRVPIPDNID